MHLNKIIILVYINSFIYALKLFLTDSNFDFELGFGTFLFNSFICVTNIKKFKYLLQGKFDIQ